MKSKVLDRPMFKKKNKDIDPENVGIMQGFADMLDEDEMAALEGSGESEDKGESEGYDTSAMAERTPKTPEILMNNLRGDMRSVDARVEELADLVGYNAAASTPTEVLALLQPVLAAEAQKGIGALPAAGMIQPPPGMMPPAMPGGMPPGMPPGMPSAAGPGMDMPPIPETTPAGMPAGGIESLMAGAGGPAPVNMYKGGLVQHFQTGSTEEGVTPADGTSSVGSYPPEMVEKARQQVMSFLTSRPLTVPDLAAETQKRVPLYERILGIDKNVSQGQALMDIGQAAFNYASNVDEQGRPLRGSGISRLARAVAPLPGKLGARIAEQAKADQAIKLTALQATEKDIADIRAQNAKLVETQRKAWADIAKSTGTKMFGSGKEGMILEYFTKLAPDYGAGKLAPEQDRMFETAIRDYTQEQQVEYVDPVTGNKSVRVIKNQLPTFVITALDARKVLNRATASTGAGTTTPSVRPSTGTAQGTRPATAAPAAAAPARAPVASQPAQGEAVSADQEGPAGGVAGGTGVTPQGAPVARTPQPPDYTKVDPFSVNPRFQSYYSKSTPNLFMASEFATGPVSAVGAGAYRTPIIGPSIAKPFGGKTAAQAREYVGNTIGALTRSLSENPNFPVYEQKSIKAELDLLPQLYDNPTAFRSRLFALDDLLIQSQDTALANSNNQQLPVKDRQMARSKVADIHRIRELIGSPLRIDSVDDPRFSQVPEGVWFLWNGNEWKRRLPAQQRGQ
jgi:hypothetical protein